MKKGVDQFESDICNKITVLPLNYNNCVIKILKYKKVGVRK